MPQNWLKTQSKATARKFENEWLIDLYQTFLSMILIAKGPFSTHKTSKIRYLNEVLTPSYHSFPANIYSLKVNNRNTRKRCKICSTLTIKTPERRQWRQILPKTKIEPWQFEGI